MSNDRIEGRAQGIRANVRELQRQGRSKSKCCLLLHFLDPNHESRAATIMKSGCGGSRGGLDIGALARRSNVVDNALVDLLHNGRRVGMGFKVLGPAQGVWS